MTWQCLQAYVKELIVWSHSSHPNVLPFYGVFLDEAQQICLVSPFMKNGNLQEYAPRLPQKPRVPFVCSSTSLVALKYLYTSTTDSFSIQSRVWTTFMDWASYTVTSKR
jgi:serine/threonine protein kinase